MPTRVAALCGLAAPATFVVGILLGVGYRLLRAAGHRSDVPADTVQT